MARRSILRDDEETKIDLSPMIDCIFILLIFFIVATVFVEEKGLQASKPDVAATSTDEESETVILQITADNKVIYGGKELGVAGVGARVKQLLLQDEPPVIIQADALSDHGVFSDVWSEVKSAGATKISISTRRD